MIFRTQYRTKYDATTIVFFVYPAKLLLSTFLDEMMSGEIFATICQVKNHTKALGRGFGGKKMAVSIRPEMSGLSLSKP
jgi:hypothetical protein